MNWGIYAAVIVALFGGLIFITADTTNKETLSQYMADKSFQIEGIDNFIVTDNSKEKIGGTVVNKVSAYLNDTTLELKILANTEYGFVKEYRKDRRLELTSAYKAAPAPYGDIPQKSSKCKQYNAKISQKNTAAYNYTIYQLPENKDHSYACSQNEAEYSKKVLIAYCRKENKLIETVVHKPVNKSAAVTLDSFSCKS